MPIYKDINQKLIMNMCHIGHILRFLYEGKGSQKQILIILYETGSITQQELTQKLGIQPGSASEVIRKLENFGLIQRTPHFCDRRTTDVSLTNQGMIEAQLAFDQRKKRHQEMFECLSTEEKDELLRITDKLINDWSSRYHERKKRKKI